MRAGNLWRSDLASRAVQERDETKIAVIGLSAAFADTVVRLRAEFPGEYAHVDKIRSVPGWVPHEPDLPHTARVAECLWCGNDFFVEQKTMRYCERACRSAHTRWLRQRQKGNGL